VEEGRLFRDFWSGFTHFIGLLLAIAALVILLNKGGNITVWQTVSYWIFGVSMIMVYLGSTLYHWVPFSGNQLEVFRKIDHIMIFVFIAASYTPLCLVTLRGPWGWSFFGAVWGITIAGVFIKIFWMNAPRFLSTAIYILMSWIIVIGIWPLSKALAPGGLIWLGMGGLFYMIGAAIYTFKKPDPLPGVFGFHEVFHLFVMMGTFSHFYLVYQYM
jgi:hemolysin III